MAKLLFIAVGGGAGALLRYLVAGWGQKLTPGVFPLGTSLDGLVTLERVRVIHYRAGAAEGEG